MSATAAKGRRIRAIRTYECPHMKAQGPLQSLKCWVCGPLRATWVSRPVISHLPQDGDA